MMNQLQPSGGGWLADLCLWQRLNCLSEYLENDTTIDSTSGNMKFDGTTFTITDLDEIFEMILKGSLRVMMCRFHLFFAEKSMVYVHIKKILFDLLKNRF